ncbi:MAG: hypothetical protein QM621_08415 [Aeromicrobium sp.]|uniref:hypothetical protein n=1 Tax=Aeromicrobium sp. TaxID=1871063 RepID=UPI0039E2BD62
MDKRQRASWLATGERRTEKWLAKSGTRLGRSIPYVLATEDQRRYGDRGWIPQGLGLDPVSGLLFQGYYYGGWVRRGAALAVLDPASERVVTDVRLGGPGLRPRHAGGVTVDGKRLLVTDRGWLYTYELDEVLNARRGRTVRQIAPTLPIDGGSYATAHEDRLYVGLFGESLLFTYERVRGGWASVGEAMSTPVNGQGVLVRDQEFVFSTSRGTHHMSKLVVRPRDAGGDDTEDRSHRLPNMSEGIVELDGELVVTYESGAAAYSRPFDGLVDGERRRGRPETMWPLARLTHTPLAEVGLSE